jgi:hypothetical protein
MLELRRRQRHPATRTCSLCQPDLDAFQTDSWFGSDGQLAGRTEWMPLGLIDNPDGVDLFDFCAEPARRPVEILAWAPGLRDAHPAIVTTVYVGRRHDSRRTWGPNEWRWVLSGAYEPHRVRTAEPD